MAITFRSYGSSPGATSATCVITKPADLALGDLMIAQVVVRRLIAPFPSVITPPTDWTNIRRDNYAVGSDIVFRSELFWKIADADDVAASDFTFTIVAAASNGGAITAWYGHDPTTPINANEGQTNEASTTVTSDGITPSVVNCVVCLFCAITDNNTQNSYAIATDNPALWSEAYDLPMDLLYDLGLSLGYAARPETSATGNGTATTSGSDANIGQLVAIAPYVIPSEYEASLALGLSLSASRSVTYARSASQVLGLALSAVRVYGRERSASLALGLALSVSRAVTYARSVAKAVGLALTASRAVTYSRSISKALGLALSVARIWGRARSASLTIGLALSVAKVTGFVKSATLPLGLALSAVRNVTYGRSAGGTTLFEYYNTTPDTAETFFGINWFAMTFTPSTTHKITSVKLKLYRTGSPGTVTVSIRATDGNGHPTGGDLCSGTTDGNTIPTTPGEWREITLGAGYDLSSPTKYAIVCRATSGSAGNQVFWFALEYQPTYSGGNGEFSNNSGGSWNYNVEDMMFEEWSIAGLQVGLSLTTSRAVTYARSATKALGLALSVVKVWGKERTASLTLGLSLIVSRAAAYNRSVAKALGLALSASRAVAYTRSASKVLGLALTVAKVKGFLRSASLALGLVLSVSRLVAFNRSASKALGLSLSASRAVTYARSMTKALGLALSVTKLRSYSRSMSKAIGLSLSVVKSWGRAKTASLTLGLKLTVLADFYKVRNLTVKVVTSQYRHFQLMTSQYRHFKIATSMYRKIKTFLFGG